MIFRWEEEVKDLTKSPGAGPLAPWAPGSETFTGLAGEEKTDCSGRNSLKLRMLNLFSSWSSQGGKGSGVDFPHFFPFTMDHGSWLAVELFALNLGFGLQVNVASALLVAHFGMAPSNSHGSPAGRCGAGTEEAGLDVTLAVASSSSVWS